MQEVHNYIIFRMLFCHTQMQKPGIHSVTQLQMSLQSPIP